jgi:hypothetical protein
VAVCVGHRGHRVSDALPDVVLSISRPLSMKRLFVAILVVDRSYIHASFCSFSRFTGLSIRSG